MFTLIFRRLFLITTVFFTALNCFGQQKEIELTKYYRRTVPPGKVWYISNTRAHKLLLPHGFFESGTACNASVHSNPAFIYGILCIDTVTQVSSLPKTFGFTVKDNPEWLHDNVYAIQPYFLIKTDLDDSVLANSLKWQYSPDEIVFYPGMVLQTSACINNLIIYERTMTVKDQKSFAAAKATLFKQKQAIEQENSNREKLVAQQKLAKFNDRSSIYKLNEINYYGRIIKDMLTDTVASKIASLFRDSIAGSSALHLYVHVLWDSTGNVTSFSGNHSLSKFPVNKLLKLQELPTVTEGANSRHCLVEADLTFSLTSGESDLVHYKIKKVKNGLLFFFSDPNEVPTSLMEHLKQLDLTKGSFYKIACAKRTTKVGFYPYHNEDSLYNSSSNQIKEVTDYVTSVTNISRKDL